MKYFAGLAWTAKHFYKRKIVQPQRERAWKDLRGSFVHRSDSGLSFRLDPRGLIDRFIYVDGIFDDRFLDFIALIFSSKPAGTMLDVGANIGNHALYLSKSFKSIHCFEPNPATVERLRENIELNHVSNITVHPVGLSNRAALLPFVDGGESNPGASHFVEVASEGTFELPIEKGDDYIKSNAINGVDLIKVDVEGHELEVFQGLSETIALNRPVVTFEYHGGLVPPSTFVNIAATMPNYVFAEACHAPADASLLAKGYWHATRCGRPILKRFSVPERRTYENILAFPDEASFSAAFAAAGGGG